MLDLNDRDKNPVVQEAIKDAIANPNNYVLKPQREGGGNNLFGEDIKDTLVNNKQVEQYLLMRWIKAPILKTYMLRMGKLTYTDSITEIGVFSLVLANSKTGEILLNEVDGLLPRTKQADCNEGGVNAGFAVVDHILPVDLKMNQLKPSVSNFLDLWLISY